MKMTKRDMSGGLVLGDSLAVCAPQKPPIDIRADLLAANLSISQALDCRAVLRRYTPAVNPLLYVLVAGQAKRLGGPNGPAKHRDGTKYVFFAAHDAHKHKLEKLAKQRILALTDQCPIHTLRAMETIHQRIRRLRKAKGLNQEQLGKAVGLSRQAVQKWESSGNDRTAPKREIQPQVAAVLGVTVAELVAGIDGDSGNYSIDTNQSAHTSYAHGNVTEGPDLGRRTFPLISWVQAGMWTDICDSFEPGDADTWLRCHKDLGPHGFVLRVQGESMTTSAGAYSFPEGMLLYVHPEMEATPGKFVIVRRNGNTATFKRLAIVDGDLYLEALNPAWPNRFIKLTEEDHICGVVVHAGFELP